MGTADCTGGIMDRLSGVFGIKKENGYVGRQAAYYFAGALWTDESLARSQYPEQARVGVRSCDSSMRSIWMTTMW